MSKKPGDCDQQYFCIGCCEWIDPAWHDSEEENANVPSEYRGHEYDDPDCPICGKFVWLKEEDASEYYEALTEDGREWSELPEVPK